MLCPHAQGCPLFPLLNASLRGWRECYCDSTDNWRTCARYQLSTMGEPVPISLLPNGVTAQHLQVHGTTPRSPGPESGFGPAGRPTQADPQARRQRPERRRWWTRIADWMTGPT